MMAYDKTKYKIWNWKHPVMLHWMINPGLAINELILGQRVPKIMLIERVAGKSLEERTKIPCPHCGTLHGGHKWSIRNNAFRNWFGLYCDHCGNTIPCLTNLTSYLILLLTFPIWFWFKDSWKRKWIERQPERYKDIDSTHFSGPYDGYGWIRQGLYWGFFMYILATFLFPLIDGEAITLSKALYGILIWTIGGLCFGYTMKLIIRRRSDKKRTM